jgi:hypothetical protein
LGEELREIAFGYAIQHALHIDARCIDYTGGTTIEDWENHPGREVLARIPNQELFLSRLRKGAADSIVMGIDVQEGRTVQE